MKVKRNTYHFSIVTSLCGYTVCPSVTPSIMYTNNHSKNHFENTTTVSHFTSQFKTKSTSASDVTYVSNLPETLSFQHYTAIIFAQWCFRRVVSNATATNDV